MKIIFLILILYSSLYGFTQQTYSIHDLKAGKFKEDSSYIYLLPFEKGKKVFLIQAYESKMSHQGERALDFKVKKGTKICAARDGVVIAARKDSREFAPKTCCLYYYVVLYVMSLLVLVLQLIFLLIGASDITSTEIMKLIGGSLIACIKPTRMVCNVERLLRHTWLRCSK